MPPTPPPLPAAPGPGGAGPQDGNAGSPRIPGPPGPQPGSRATPRAAPRATPGIGAGHGAVPGKPAGSPASKGAPDAPPAMAAAPLRALPLTPAPAGSRPGAPSRALQDAWVARLKARDPRALAEVVEAFGERLTAVVAGMLRDRDAVDDVVQAAFTKAWFRIDSFAGDSSLYTWLYRVAVNACKDHAKGRARRPAALLGDLAARGGEEGEEPGALELEAAPQPPLEGLERRELRAAVQRAIARLPERFRCVLALREIEGLPYQEIATVLGLSLGTVESRLFRARQRLSALLAREGLRPTPPPGSPPDGHDDIP